MKRNTKAKNPIPKRIKLDQNKESAEKKDLEFIDLIEDGVFAIFNYLSPADLCSMQFTCKRFHDLASNHFERKFADKTITIRQFPNKDCDFAINSTEKYLKYFIKSIQNVIIKGYSTHNNTHDLINFVKTNCGENLKSLKFNIPCRITEEHVVTIKEKLQHLERISISEPSPRSNVYDGLLKHCENLKHLEIHSRRDTDTFWLLHNFEHLESIDIHLMGKNDSIQIELFFDQFLQRHRKIKNITCQDPDIIKGVLRNIGNLERLSLNVAGETLSDIAEDMSAYSRKFQIKRFEIFLRKPLNKGIDVLKKIEKFQPIHKLKIMSIFHITDPTLIMICQLTSIIDLELDSVFDTIRITTQNTIVATIPKSMPSLENLYIRVCKYMPFDLNSWIHQLTFAIKLKKLVIKVHSILKFKWEDFDLCALDSIRCKMPGANHLTIIIQHFYPFTRPAHLSVKTRMVNLKFMEF